MSDFYNTAYNPDVLSCIANLSNDEVFTPPEIANKMLDMLPQELFSDPNTTFLDPACKSGVFLREIAKRLIDGLADQIPDLQERIDHIFQKQLYGIAITELTSLLSRRSLYCSKYPNSKYSVTRFDDVQGNIRYKNIHHTWMNGKCVFCGASQEMFGEQVRENLEYHAYEFIHTLKPEDIFNMKFDVIIGNPPYQLNTGGGNDESAKQARPLYNLFVEQSKKLRPRFLTMIIPSRWFAGGMGLDSFRDTMLGDGHLIQMVDYPNAKDCFPQNSIGGGVCYFLWSRDEKGLCSFTSKSGEISNTALRDLKEFPIFVRYNQAIDIIHKVQSKNEKSLASIVSSLNPFGFSSYSRGLETDFNNSIKLHSSKGVGFVNRKEVLQGKNYIDKYQVMVSKTTGEHAGEPGKDGTFKVLAKFQPLPPKEICTFSYFLVGNFDNEIENNNLYGYLKTKFARFLLLQAISSINISKEKFMFVPLQDFSKLWTDEELYEKYNLTQEEIDFIESMIKPMEIDGV